MDIIISEIKSDKIEMYKAFIQIGLKEDENNFRISPADDAKAGFPTQGTEDSFTLGAFIGDSLAGAASFTRDGRDREKLRHKGILFRMYVAPAFRGRGIAKLLIENIIERAKLLENIEQINLTVVASNSKAKLMYEKFGFTTFAHELNAIKWKGNYFHENHMVLKIKAKK